MSKTLFVGIDISLKEATCCFLNQKGNLVRKIFKVDNNISGFEKLKEEIESAIPTNNFSLPLYWFGSNQYVWISPFPGYPVSQAV